MSYAVMVPVKDPYQYHCGVWRWDTWTVEETEDEARSAASRWRSSVQDIPEYRGIRGAVLRYYDEHRWSDLPSVYHII